ncbi:hypothetical protein ACTWQB_16255, partial [Piscibacillus sp. B03]|uniref:hypothetical protein n=1 Tax=Piscibacillus sp. B03 TaxID=3457430 RepID=UPI003FCCCB8F
MALEPLTREEIETLSIKSRNRELVKGVVRTVSRMTIPVQQKDGTTRSEETEVAIFHLEGGITGYCPRDYFREHDFATLNGFVGTQHDVVIHQLNLENQIAIVSVIEADKQKANNFLNEIRTLDEQGRLQEKVYEGVVQNLNIRTQTVHLRVEGQDCFLKEGEWSWNRRNELPVEVDRGMTVPVVVKRFSQQEDGSVLVEVSRRLTMEDPFERLQSMRQSDLVMGKVSRVDPIHGIFVAVEGV